MDRRSCVPAPAAMHPAAMTATDLWQPRASVAAAPAYRPGRSAAQALAETGIGDALALASNELPFGPLPSVRQAIVDAAGSVNRYPDPRALALRTALAKHVDVDVERVVVGAGSNALLYQLIHALADGDDDVVFPWPTFEGYAVAVALSGARQVRVPLSNHRVDPAALVAAIGERTRLVVIAEPNNPTGTSLSGAELEVLCEATADRCLLVIDEAYHDFRTGAPIDALALAAAHRHVVVLRTFSKAHGLAGLRVGYAVADPGVVELIDKVTPPFSVSAMAQAAAAASIQAHDELRARVAMVVAERDQLIAGLHAQGWDVPASEANFVWLPMTDGDATMSMVAGLERHGVLVRPLPGGVRITIGEPGTAARVLAALDDVMPPITMSNARRNKGADHG